MLINAKDKNLEQDIGTLPNVAGAIRNQMRPMVFSVIRQVVDQTTFDVDETPVEFRTHAQLQPYKPTELEIQAVGSRSWQWSILRALPDLVMKNQDWVLIGDRKFRVMYVFPWQDYGYVEYKLVEDFQ